MSRPTIVHMIASPIRSAPRELMYRLLACMDRTAYQPAAAFIREGREEARAFDVGFMLEDFEKLGIPVCVAGMEHLWDVRGGRRLYSFLDELDASLLVSHLSRADLWAALLGWRKGAPTVPVVHGLDPFRAASPLEPAYVRRLVDRFVLRRASRIVCVSEVSRRQLIERQKVAPEKIAWIPGGIDVAKFRTSIQPFPPGRPPTLAMITRVHEDKGICEFVDAVAGLQQSRPDVRALVAGDGPPLKAMRARARDKGARVEFLGHVANVPGLLADIDVFVLPSYHEGTPLSLIEAMAAGRVAVVSDVGGMPDMVRSGVSGYVVPPRDTAALERSLADCIAHPERGRRLSAHAARDAAAYSMDRICRQWARLYEQVLGLGG